MSSKTITFLGASTGVGLSALQQSLAAGHDCIALCRTPSKLTGIISPESTPNLRVLSGNAHDTAALRQAFVKEDGSLVDTIVTTIGGKPDLLTLTIDDPHVCQKGMTALLETLSQLRKDGHSGSPTIVVFSTTGISKHGRDVPWLLVPLYHVALKVPHVDKEIMEADLMASGEDYTIVRGSLLMGGASETPIRVGIESESGRESDAIGYTISREDAGRWLAENLLLKRDPQYVKKIATITY